jgi:predicted transcriptional regulator
MGQESERTPLSEAQIEIMHAIWEHGDSTVAEVWKVLSEQRRLSRNTVLTQMARLEEKGWLRRCPQTNPTRFAPAVARASALRQVVARMVDTAFGGSADGLVMTLLDAKGISKEQAVRIRAMIERAEKES